MAAPFALGNMAQYSLQLLRGQMINQLAHVQLAHQAVGQTGYNGLSLQEFIKGKRDRPKRRDPGIMLGEALNGIMRSDPGLLRHASINLSEGVKIAKLASESVMAIQEKIRCMRETVRDLRAPEQGSNIRLALRAEYNRMSGLIAADVQNASYRGMKILDGSAWKQEKYITPDPGGDTGKIVLQAGRETVALTLFNIASLTRFRPTDTEEGSLTVTDRMLLEVNSLFSSIREIYDARATLYAAESVSYERRADLLDAARQRVNPGDEQALRDILLEIIMREPGTFFNLRT